MADRNVTVDVDADTAGYNSKILASAAVTKAFAHEGGLADQAVAGIGNSANRSSPAIDRLSGRLRIIRDIILAIGPAAVPLGAVAVPGIMGLASAAGFATVGLGSVLLATHGVSAALKAMNTAALDPTDAHLKKAQQTMGQLGIDAQEFVIHLRAMIPQFKELQNATAEGFFGGGVTRSLTDLEAILPKIQRITTATATAIGGGVADSAESLASERWAKFFDFLQTEAPPAVAATMKAIGSLTHGLAELWMAFMPLNDDVLGFLQDSAAGFDEWAGHLDQTKGFQEFVGYIEAQGPQVEATLGAIANAALQIVEAMAPIGGPVLQILQALAETIAVIADSDIGTPLIAGIAAIAALNRGQQLFTIARDSAFGKRAVGSITGYAGALTKVVSVQERATMSVKEMAAAERARFGQIARGTAALAGLGLIVTGVADEAGYGTAATLGLTGAMVGGVPGAVVGGLVGAALDIKHAMSEASDGVKEWHAATQEAVSSGDFAQLEQTATDAQAAFEKFQSDISNDSIMHSMGKFLDPQDLSQIFSELNGGSTVLSRYAEQADESTQATYNLEGALTTVGRVAGDFGRVDIDFLNKTLANAKPAMTALGITTQDLSDAFDAGDGSLLDYANRIHDWNMTADTTKGRTDAVAAAIAALGDESATTSDKADALKASLDALLGPGLDLSAATDAWRVGLRDLNSELSDAGRHLVGFTKDATENRAVIRSRVGDLTTMLEKQAGAGATADELSASLRRNRKALLDAGEAAGLYRPKLNAYLNTLGLTPALVKTVLKLVGTEEAKKSAKDTKAEIDKLPPEKKTVITADNHQALAVIHSTQASLDAMRDKVITITIVHQEVKLANGGHSGGGDGGGGNAGHDSRTYTGGFNYTDTTPTAGAFYRGGSRGGNGSLPPLGGGSGKNHDDGSGGFGSDSSGPLGKIIQALMSAGFGPGQIRSFQKSINELQRAVSKNKGKWNDDLRQQARDLMKEIRKAEIERRKAIREAFKGFTHDLSSGAAEIHDELRQLKRDLQDAGGVWDKAMRHHANRILELSKRYDSQAALLDQQQTTLESYQSTLDDLISAQSQFANEVTGHFNNDPFGNGLAGFFSQTGTNTQQASLFESVLKQLADMGLDGAAFQALAASGDLNTAIQLLNSGSVDAFEAAYNNQQSALGSLGQYAGNQVYGAQIDNMTLAVRQQTALVEQTKGVMQHLQDLVAHQEQVMQQMAGDIKRASKEGSYNGTYDGVKDATSGAGRAVAVAQGPRSDGGAWGGVWHR